MKDGNNMRIKSVDRMAQTWWFYAVTAVQWQLYSAYSWTPHILEYAELSIFEALGKNSHYALVVFFKTF